MLITATGFGSIIFQIVGTVLSSFGRTTTVDKTQAWSILLFPVSTLEFKMQRNSMASTKSQESLL